MDQQALDALMFGLEDENWDSTTLSSSPVAPLRPITPRKPLSRARLLHSPKKQQPLASKSVNTPKKPAPFWPLVVKESTARATPLRGGKENAQPVVQNVKMEYDLDGLLDGMDFDDGFLPTQEEPVKVPLSQRYHRCSIASVSDVISAGPGKMYRTLQVRLRNDEELYDVRLGDDWIETPLEIGDVVNLVGDFSPLKSPALVIDRQKGFLVLHPDILVSSTKVADTPNCARKPILQELIRVVGGSSEPLVYGNMLHELLQACLTEGNFDDDWREDKIDELLVKEMATLWSIDVDVQKARMEMKEKSKEFSQFSDRFRGDSPEPDAFIADPHTMNTGSARLAITKTLAVEEDIWSPKYGLKGKVDVSVMGRILEEGESSRSGDGVEAVIPFEIKTGKTVTALEHRAQTMLYTLMMSDRYNEDVDSGILYYSSSNTVIRVTPARNEIRGLIIARNGFATYLHRRMNLSVAAYLPQTQGNGALPTQDTDTPRVKVEEPELEDVDGQELLPPPIDDIRRCKRCYVVDACMLYRKAVEGSDGPTPNGEDPLQLVFEEKTDHLTPQHSAFFKKWERLISLEEQEMVRFKKEIWTMGAEERAKVGRCIANVSIDGSFKAAEHRAGAKMFSFTYRLRINPATPSQPKSPIGGNLAVNDPIVVSLESPYVLAVSRGFVLDITPLGITLGLDQSLVDNAQAKRSIPRLESSDLIFRIDKDELAAGLGRIRDNLIQLFVVGGDAKRRRLVVDLEPPIFVESTLDIIPSHLNSDQTSAIRKVLAMKDYALILGMPGTGKTTTIAEVLKTLVKAGKSVLLTSYTHSAVDNILLKVLDSDIAVLRLGNREKVMPSIHKYMIDPANPPKTMTELDNRYMTPQVVAATCLSINEAVFTRRRFDVCIVDEASQVTLPTCLGPLRFADTFVLVGDHHQLPPLVRNPDARKGGLDVSLFKLLATAHPDAVVQLTQQYRMNKDIMHLSNKLVYQDRMHVGSLEIANRRLELPRPQGLDELGLAVGAKCWISDLLDPKRAVVFVDTDSIPAQETKAGPLIENPVEAELVAQTTRALIRCGIAETQIGIIAPYRQQIRLISSLLTDHTDIEVLTADKSQGRDKDCILMSLTRSNTDNQVGDLLKDWRRINVSITRARAKLIIFGSRSTLANLALLQQFFAIVDDKGWLYSLPAQARAAYSPEVSKVESREKREREEEGGSHKKARVDVARFALVADIVNSV